MSKMGMRAAAVALAMGIVVAGTEASASAAKLTLESSKDAVLFGKKIRIDGELTPDAGVPAGDHVVRLFATPFPYKRSSVVSMTTTDAQGRYEFRRVRPDFNTRYRVEVADPTVRERSGDKLVVSLPRLEQNGRVTGDNRFVTTLTVRYSRDLPTNLDGSRVSFYFRELNGGSYLRRDRARARVVSPGVLRARGSFGLPSGNFEFQSLGCVDFDQKGDFGLFLPNTQTSCPRKLSLRSGRVPRAQALADFSSRSASPFIP